MHSILHNDQTIDWCNIETRPVQTDRTAGISKDVQSMSVLRSKYKVYATLIPKQYKYRIGYFWDYYV